MSYASMLVHVEHASPSSDARLALAAALARRFAATLIGVAAGEVRPPPAGPRVLLYDDAAVAAEEAEIRAGLTAAAQAFRSHPAAAGLATEWRSAIDMPAQVLARESRSADLVIVGRDPERLRAGACRSADPGEVMLAAGRPVLVVPPDVDALAGARIVVGWKDAREARRALRDALPFLRAAESVHLVEVTDEADLEPAYQRVADVVRHLGRHRAKARGEVRRQREHAVADELILAAEQHGADLIVAGGYGHARLLERVFGGVTRDLLSHCPKCCIVSH